jgi:hypothetical protein
MHLINPLVAGIRGAEVGSVELLERGTSTHAVYYKDFPASQQYSVQPIPLDSFGSATLYVEELVDVLVHDSNGVLVRQFVAGDYAAAVEVISQSFTGTDYRDGTKGPFKPTNLASVLDLWKTQQGAIDWKVLVGGAPVTIGDALSSFAGLYFNVKSFGALGNGIADDGAAINAAIAAAAVAGGTVFFPPGVFRTTVVISIPNNVCVLGSGAPASKLAIDNAGAFCLTFGLGPADSGPRTIRNLWVGSINTITTQSLVMADNPTLRTVIEDCLFGNDTTTKGVHVSIQTGSQDSLVQFNRCSFYEMAGASIITEPSSGVGRSVFRDCIFKSLFTGFTSAPHIVARDGMLVDGCWFDASALAGGVFAYVQLNMASPADGSWGGDKFTNNRFKKGAATVAAFRNTAAVPTAGIWESGNSFGTNTGGFLPLYLETTDGYADFVMDVAGLRTHGSRLSRSWGSLSNTDVLIDAKNYALAVIKRTAAGAQVVTATLGSVGDTLTIQIVNASGVTVTPTFGSMFLGGSGITSGIGTGGSGQYKFDFLPVGVGTTGKWVMTGITFTI